MAAAVPFVPLVGGALGVVCGLVADLLVPTLPSLVAGALAVALAAALTGALHLDGLADTADALGARTRAQALAIMRDHTLGTYGSTALVVVVLVDAAALGALAERDRAAVVALGAGAAARAAMLPLVRLAYARPGEGQGRLLQRTGRASVAAGVVTGVALALPAGSAGLAGVAAAALVSLGAGLAARRGLGGVTGDVLGAAAKLAETAFLVAALAVVR